MARTLLDWLVKRFPTAKRQTLRRMAAAGRVLVNDRPVHKVNVPLADADRVTVADRPSAGGAVNVVNATKGARGARPAAGGARPSTPRRPGAADEAADRDEVIYEDADLLVVHKPAGLLTSTVPRERRPTLLERVRRHMAERDPRARVGLIHRLDRDASGLLVFSKNDAAYHSLKTQFFHHDVERVYAAVVRGVPVPPAGRIESRLVERADGTVHSTRQIGKGQEAVTHYEVVRSDGKRTLVRVTLHTGRKHQIRVHLGERGWPIVGDSVYGRGRQGKLEGPGQGTPKSSSGERLLLVATRLVVTHPRTGERLVFETPPPAALERAVGAARPVVREEDPHPSPLAGSRPIRSPLPEYREREEGVRPQ